jgi:hypothetical protein
VAVFPLLFNRPSWFVLLTDWLKWSNQGGISWVRHVARSMGYNLRLAAKTINCVVFNGATAKASSLSWIHDHTQTHHTRCDSFGWVVSPTQRPLPDNTQHSQGTKFYAPGRILTRNPSTQVPVDTPYMARPRDPAVNHAYTVKITEQFRRSVRYTTYWYIFTCGTRTRPQ